MENKIQELTDKIYVKGWKKEMRKSTPCERGSGSGGKLIEDAKKQLSLYW